MTAYDETPITVYEIAADLTRKCEFGGKHRGYVVAAKRLGPVTGKRIHNNGYYARETPLRQDAQGRTYHYHEPIDYWGGGSWLRDGDGAHFSGRWGGEFQIEVQDYAFRSSDEIKWRSVYTVPKR